MASSKITAVAVLGCIIGQALAGMKRDWDQLLSGMENETKARRRLTPEGFYLYTFPVDNVQRQFVVYVPSGVNKTSPASGMVMFFHGLSARLDVTCGGYHDSGFAAGHMADREQFIVVCPLGLGRVGSTNGWNCEVCCGYPVGRTDDVGFVKLLMDKLKEEVLPVDFGVDYPQNRVFAMGFSTGGLFSYRIACEIKDRIDGVAVIGAAWDWGFGVSKQMTWTKQCRSGVPVWNGIGTRDVFTKSDVALAKWRFYSTQVLSCSPAGLSTSSPTGDANVTCSEYADCGSKMCIYKGMLHTVRPMGTHYNYWATEQAWAYLSQFSQSKKETRNNVFLP